MSYSLQVVKCHLFKIVNFNMNFAVCRKKDFCRVCCSLIPAMGPSFTKAVIYLINELKLKDTSPMQSHLYYCHSKSQQNSQYIFLFNLNLSHRVKTHFNKTYVTSLLWTLQ